MKRIGGVWRDSNPHHKQVDGDKFMCFDTIVRAKSPCLIYSFGINDDWTFEDLMDSFGISNLWKKMSKYLVFSIYIFGMYILRVWDFRLRPHNKGSTKERKEHQILQDRAGRGILSVEDIEGPDHTKQPHGRHNRISKGDQYSSSPLVSACIW